MMTKEDILIKHCATDGQFCYENEIDCYTSQAVSAMDEWAKQESIAFATWLKSGIETIYVYNGNNEWRGLTPSKEPIEDKIFSSDQLYNLFLKSKTEKP